MTNDDLSSELQILLCCARTELDTATVERLTGLLTQPPDWPGLLRLAQRHGVMPLLYRALNEHGVALTPPAILAELRTQYQANARRNVVLTRELLRLLALLEQHGIPAIPYKGPALAMAAYGDLALRQFGDLDVLVPRHEAERAQSVLLAQGYHRLHRLTPMQEMAYRQGRCHNHYNLSKADLPINVELHWDIAPAHFFQPGATLPLWQTAATVALAGGETTHFSAETLVLLLCVHGTKHCWDRLALICDLAELAHRQPALDWAAVMARAQSWRVEAMIQLGLLLAHDLLAAKFPTAILPPAGVSPRVRRLAGQVIHQLKPTVPPLSPLQTALFRLRAQSSARDRLSYLWHSLLTPTPAEWLAVNRPGLPASLYYLVRPARLLKTYWPGRRHA
ncbi:MAG: hypothetical protein FOGNACKC_03209 [Anaerolineae bacterium]|nr:hypothetical protein [Anaerolineae bacterium]